MRALFACELKRYFVTPLAWLLFAASLLLLAWAFFSELEYYEQLQARLVATQSPLGVTSLVVIPALLNGLNIIMLIVPLVTMRMLAAEKNQQLELLLASPLRSAGILMAKYLAGLVLFLLLWLALLLMVLSLNNFTSLDNGRILLLWLMGIPVIAFFTALGTWTSSLTSHPAVAAIAAYALLVLFRLAGQAEEDTLLAWFSITSHLRDAQHGLFNSSDLVYLLLVTGLFLLLAWIRLIHLRNLQDRWSSRIAVTLMITCLALSWPFLRENSYTLDLSSQQHNTLSNASREVLQKLDGPLSFTVYSSDDAAVVKRQVQQLLKRFQREKENISIRFVDPREHPKASRTLGITRNGEILVRYNERQQMVKKADENAIRQTLLQLAEDRQGWILSLRGHGEMDLFGEGLFDASLLTANLRARGYRLRDFNLIEHAQIPDNTLVLMIAAAEEELTDSEILEIQRYLHKGGNLLWLTEPDRGFSRKLQPPLPEVGLLPGVIVDAAAARLGLDRPDNAVVTHYTPHPIIDGLTRFTLFPQAAALTASNLHGWELLAQLSTGATSWNETGPVKGDVERDPVLFEENGPLPVGQLFSRQHNDKEQRLALFADSDFLRNQAIGLGDNLLMTLNLFYWLSGDDPKTAETSPAADQSLQISDRQRLVYAGIFLFALPGLLFFCGLLIPAWRRKRQ